MAAASRAVAGLVTIVLVLGDQLASIVVALSVGTSATDVVTRALTVPNVRTT